MKRPCELLTAHPPPYFGQVSIPFVSLLRFANPSLC